MVKKYLLIANFFIAGCSSMDDGFRQRWLVNRATAEMNLTYKQVQSLNSVLTDLRQEKDKMNYTADLLTYYEQEGFNRKGANIYINKEMEKLTRLAKDTINEMGEFYNSLDKDQRKKFHHLLNRYGSTKSSQLKGGDDPVADQLAE